MRVDQVDLDVVFEQRARSRPGLVVACRAGSVELFLGELGDLGDSRRPTRSKSANVARVWPWLSVVCSRSGSSVVLPRISSSVARQALVHEVTRERAAGERFLQLIDARRREQLEARIDYRTLNSNDKQEDRL